MCCFVFFFKQNTAYEMRISDWSSDVCSSDLELATPPVRPSHPSAPARGPLAMAKILVGYERGEGLGHYRRLAPVAEALAAEGHQVVRSEGRRVGKEWVSTCRSRGAPYL